MGCINKIYSVSAVLGGPNCNAKCPSCAGQVLRPMASNQQQESWHKAPRNIVPASRLALNYGAWSLALTSSGEPTLYPDAITDTLKTLKDNGVQWPFINLFTNGVLLAKNKLPLKEWKELGLTSIALSVHHTDSKRNALAYGFDSMYEIPDAIKIIRDAGLSARIVLLLGKNNIGTLDEYVKNLNQLKEWKAGLITSWEIKANNGQRIEQTPSRWEMLKIRAWLLAKTDPVMGHVWGGMVRNYKGMNIRLTDYVSKHSPRNDYIRQLVLLPDGKVSYSWFQQGMFCLD